MQTLSDDFSRSLNNFLHAFSGQVDAGLCIKNSNTAPELIFEQQGEVRNIVEAQHYQYLLKEIAS